MTADDQKTLNHVRALAWLLDRAVPIPGTKFRVGLDPVLDLIPGVGDAAGVLISSYLLVTAARLGVPRAVLARMLLNVGVDAAVGAVPFVGAVFDAAWRANSMNAALLEKALTEPAPTKRASRWTMIGLVLAVLALVGGGVALGVWLVSLAVE